MVRRLKAGHDTAGTARAATMVPLTAVLIHSPRNDCVDRLQGRHGRRRHGIGATTAVSGPR